LDHPNKLTNKWTVQKIEALSNICGDTNTIVVIFEGGKFGILNLTTSEFEELKEKSKDFQDIKERTKKDYRGEVYFCLTHNKDFIVV